MSLMPEEYDVLVVLGEDGEIHELENPSEDEKAKISPSRIIGKRKTNPRKKKLKAVNRHVLKLVRLIVIAILLGFAGIGFLVVRQATFNPASPKSIMCPEMSTWWDGVTPTVIEFLDTTQLTASLNREEAIPLVLELQRIEREFNQLEAPICTLGVREPLRLGFRYVISVFQEFLAGTYEIHGAYDYHFLDSVEELNKWGIEGLAVDDRLENPGILGIERAKFRPTS
jgi:hypothetical protein